MTRIHTHGNAKPWRVHTGYVHESPQHARWEGSDQRVPLRIYLQLIGGALLLLAVFALIPLAVETVGSFLPHSQPRCGECLR